jgi:DNA-binding SARP family transcriptional activator/tetratricopeptide (TPR) repeat protein
MDSGERSTRRASIRFRLLGPVYVETDGRPLTPPRRQERCLLAILLLEQGRVVPVDRLCDLLWDGEPPERAYQSLRSQVAHLRALLARADPDCHVSLVSDRRGYALKAPADAVDAYRFRALVDRAGTTNLFERERLLRDALGLWRGPALHNAAPDRVRHRLCIELEELRMQAIEESMATGLALGRAAELVPQLARLNIEHPERERLVELHMRALCQQGRTTDALEVYRQTRDRLARELGLHPGPSLQELQQAILRGDSFHSPEPPLLPSTPGPLAPALLPADLPSFVGRTEHLDSLDALLASKATTGVVSSITGTAGIGKTALAVHWAHRVRDLFPDGQLYVNLRGFDPGCPPILPAEVVRRFLDALQVPAHRIPSSVDAQADLYRSVLAGRRVLILLDNARDADQVRPLLPGAPGCLTVVTSRARLAGLVAVEGAQSLTLDLVTTDEARELLAARLGFDRLAAEAGAVDQLIARCARLPLALAIAAAHTATRPDLSLAALVTSLDEAKAALDVLTGDDAAIDLRAVFSCSYGALGADAARLFRLLGLHPGPEISAPAAASLAAVPVVHVESLLAELSHAHLLNEHAPGRYGFHDLLRTYASELANQCETPTDRDGAVLRVLDHYSHTAHCAAMLLQPRRRPIVLAPPEPGITCSPLADHQQALNWLAMERSVLVAAIHHASEYGFDAHAWQLAWSLADFLERRGEWHTRASVDRTALHAARRRADRPGQAEAHGRLATAYAGLRRYGDAQTHARHALDLYVELTDHAGQAKTHQGLSWMFVRHERPDLALRHAHAAHELFRTAGDRSGEAAALNNVGWDHALLGNHQLTLVACQQALVLFQDIDDRRGQALTWDSLGYAHHQLARHEQAIVCYDHALQIFRDLGDRYNEAGTLTNLGDALHAAGDPHAARQVRQHAQSILDDLEHPSADAVRAMASR